MTESFRAGEGQGTEIVCVICPTGCRLRVRHPTAAAAREQAPEPEVVGWACERGLEYATSELEAPRRVFTGTIRVRGGDRPLVSVRSDRPLHRDRLRAMARATATRELEAPVTAGTLVAEGLSEGASLIATSHVEALGQAPGPPGRRPPGRRPPARPPVE